MARDAAALKIQKWAATGDVQDPEDDGLNRSTGFDATYSQPGGSLPKREHINEILRELSALGVELNVHGILEWHSGSGYGHPAVVIGSDGNLYISQQDSTGVDPTGDADDSHWAPLPTQIINASTSAAGSVRLATIAETIAGMLTNVAVTPAGLAARTLGPQFWALRGR